ncbi:MAG: hypothetical protein OXU96_12360 [Gammaproteobacteria bacterium]|nr:hypothetical protein [Gammaproteobacteria bacterium]
MLVGLTALAAIAAYSFGMWMAGDSLKADELAHYPQIKAFAEGRFEIKRGLAMLPGYHAVIAALAWVGGVGGALSLPAARVISWGLCALAPVLFFLCARALGKDNRFSLSLTFLLSPIIFPFFFFLYTDIPSLLFLLGVLLLTLQRRYQLAGLMAVLSLLLRQTNVIWIFFFALVALGQEGVWTRLAQRDFRPVLHALARLWLFVFAGLAFLAFVYWHGGIALGAAHMLRVERLYPTQVYLLLFTVFLLFMPLHIRNLPRIARMLRRRPVICLFVGAMSLAFYLWTFWADHPWNSNLSYLRNQILQLLREDLYLRIAAFIPMAWALCSLCVTPLQRRSFYWLYPLAAAALLPAGLVEQRYFIVPVTLFMLAKKHQSTPLDLWTIAVYAPVTGLLYYRISEGGFFL